VALLRGGPDAIAGVDDPTTRDKLKEAARFLPPVRVTSPTLGSAPVGTELSVFGLVRDVFWIGNREQWEAPLVNNVGLCADHHGAVVFIGGGAMMEPGVEQALQRRDVEIFLMKPNPQTTLEPGNDGGASARWAAKVEAARRADANAYPNVHVFVAGADLGAMMENVMQARGPAKATIPASGPLVKDPAAFAAAFTDGRVVTPQGLCGRILRGNRPAQFEALSDDPTRKLILMTGSEGLQSLMGKPGYDMLLSVGYKPEFIRRKLVDEGNRFKLVVCASDSVGLQATWANVVDMVGRAYPSLRQKIEARLEELRTTAFADIEAAAGYHFADITPDDPRFMNVDNFAQSAGTLVDVRGFLFHSIYLTDLFWGDGYTHTEDGSRGVAEYICNNAKVADLGAHAMVDIDVSLPN
jgi:hypothetical protein